MRRYRDAQLKWSYVTRCVPAGSGATIGPHASSPASGDLVVARVVRLGAHDHLENPHGRRVRLYPGDAIVGAYGNRYATDFYEGYVPESSTCHMLTAGGLIGTVASMHDARDEPTELEVLGRVVDGEGRPVSTDTYARALPELQAPQMGTIAVVGSGMNAGKTTTVTALVHGLSRAGITTGAGKVTGSGSGKDRWAYVDAGAEGVLEFLDFGMPSTFGYDDARLHATMLGIRSALAAGGAEVVVLELADGLLQKDTRSLLGHLDGVVDAIVVAAVDALSARASVEVLRNMELPVRAVSGMLTRSPLATREAEEAIGVPVLSPTELAESGLGLVFRSAGVAAA
jgi:hypothetical protein